VCDLYPDDTELNNRMLMSCICNKPDDLKEILQNPDSDPSIHENRAIREAVSLCHPDIVEILVNDNRVDPSVDNNYCIDNDDLYPGPLNDNQKRIITLLCNNIKVKAKSIKLNQDWHSPEDVELIRTQYPELLI